MKDVTRRFSVVVALVVVFAAVASQAASALPVPELVDVDAALVSGTAAAPVEWIGGGGTYSFNGTATGASVSVPCESDADTDCTLGVLDAETVAGSFNSSGSFTNIVCGTGIASGTAVLNEGGGSDSYNISYTIVFAGTVGVIVGTASEAGSSEIGVVGGVVQISPTGGGLPDPTDLHLPPDPTFPTGDDGIGGDCTDGFTVTGVIATNI